MNSNKNLKTIQDGIIKYIYENTSYESNDAINDIINKIEHSTNLDTIFKYPIDSRLFNYDEAIKWLFFLFNTIKYIAEEEISVPSTHSYYLNMNDSITYINNIYTIVKESLSEYFDSDSESETD